MAGEDRRHAPVSTGGPTRSSRGGRSGRRITTGGDPMAAKDDLGRTGEELACRWLERRGCTVLDRNWPCRTGVIDLDVQDGAYRVVVGGKTRGSVRTGHPA